jgi:hypothetical protein
LSQAYGEQGDMSGAARAVQRAYEADNYLAAPQVLDRLFETSYNIERFDRSGSWCEEGYRRFPRDDRFTLCRLWQLTVPGASPAPGEAWRLHAALREVMPATEWRYWDRYGRLLVAGALERERQGAGRASPVSADSVRRVLATGHGTPDVDASRKLLEVEAVMQATVLGDLDAAFRLANEFLAANPQHRREFGRTQLWWWRDLQKDPRWKKLVRG